MNIRNSHIIILLSIILFLAGLIINTIFREDKEDLLLMKSVGPAQTAVSHTEGLAHV